MIFVQRLKIDIQRIRRDKPAEEADKLETLIAMIPSGN